VNSARSTAYGEISAGPASLAACLNPCCFPTLIACHTYHPDLDDEASTNRATLIAALTAVGLVNYPTEWWHWSYGDRYWAYTTGVPAARYGPVSLPEHG